MKPLNERTSRRIAFDDRRPSFALRECVLRFIQAQFSFARARIGTVARIAIIRQDRLDVFVERKLRARDDCCGGWLDLGFGPAASLR